MRVENTYQMTTCTRMHRISESQRKDTVTRESMQDSTGYTVSISDEAAKKALEAKKTDENQNTEVCIFQFFALHVKCNQLLLTDNISPEEMMSIPMDERGMPTEEDYEHVEKQLAEYVSVLKEFWIDRSNPETWTKLGNKNLCMAINNALKERVYTDLPQ